MKKIELSSYSQDLVKHRKVNNNNEVKNKQNNISLYNKVLTCPGYQGPGWPILSTIV